MLTEESKRRCSTHSTASSLPQFSTRGGGASGQRREGLLNFASGELLARRTIFWMEEPFDLQGTICLKDAITFVEPGWLPGRKEMAAVGNLRESKWMFTFA